MMMNIFSILLILLSSTWTRGYNLNRRDALAVPKDLKLGILLPVDLDYLWSTKRVLPAIEIAVQYIEGHTDLLKDFRFSSSLMDTKCSPTFGPLAAFDLYKEDRAHVFFGPVCNYALAPVARYSPYWDIPVITAGGQVVAFNSRVGKYDLLTTVIGSYSKLADFFEEILKAFSWQNVSLFYKGDKTGERSSFHTVAAIYKTLSRDSSRSVKHFKMDRKSKATIREVLYQASNNSRIMIFCADADDLRETMIVATELGMDNGDYVFINVDLFGSKNRLLQQWYQPDDENNERVKKAYESLLTVTLRRPDSQEFRRFSYEVKRRARATYMDVPHTEDEVNNYVAAFHDAVILYALALNETVEAGFDVTDGSEVTKRMWNRTFTGISGTVSIDENGDRDPDYSLLDQNPVTGQFEVVANYYGNKKVYEPVVGKQIHWGGGRTDIPTDRANCSLDGAECSGNKA